MYIDRVPNRTSPPAILIRESYREDGKVRKRTLANITNLPAVLVVVLSRSLERSYPRRMLSKE